MIRSDNKIKRIVYITCKSDLTRGGQRSLLQLVERLDRDRFSPSVIVPKPGSLSRKLFRRGIKTYDVNIPPVSLRKPIKMYRAYNKLRRIFDDIQPDLIHADAPRVAHFSAVAKRNSKLLMHLRVATPDGLSDSLLALECDRLVAISRAVARRFQHLPNGRKKLSIIYNGIDTELFHPVTSQEKLAIRKLYKLPATNVLVGFFAGFVSIKGHDFIIDLWKSVIEKSENTTLVLAGDQPHEEKKRLKNRIQEENLSRHILMIPFIPEPEKILPAFDIMILPSIEEGFGRILIEAGACGVPVIGADIAGIDEAIEHDKTGFLAGVRDSEQWINALNNMINNKELRKSFGDQGRKMVEKRFSMNRLVKEIEEEYDRLVC
ncbi:MAG: glycosyltransferase family 4 protein [Candidatus Electryonea clarkiae]|nr:glycosyltransferase family 4 protein [Candidatus Electryonea clarkiae]MDP8285274.1 glycosyltransferase family 4 protein [Candidatus Electryonea clarkiae]